jgi:hypothetical protein
MFNKSIITFNISECNSVINNLDKVNFTSEINDYVNFVNEFCSKKYDKIYPYKINYLACIITINIHNVDITGNLIDINIIETIRKQLNPTIKDIKYIF